RCSTGNRRSKERTGILIPRFLGKTHGTVCVYVASLLYQRAAPDVPITRFAVSG
ncbi:MAG: hypothetical protein XD69_1167, partial [Clostridia bacterium 62_21]